VLAFADEFKLNDAVIVIGIFGVFPKVKVPVDGEKYPWESIDSVNAVIAPLFPGGNIQCCG
jgi:hypothetical protein